MLVFGFDRGRLAEVDSYSFSHYGFAIEDFADADGGFLVPEGNNYSTKRFERGP